MSILFYRVFHTYSFPFGGHMPSGVEGFLEHPVVSCLFLHFLCFNYLLDASENECDNLCLGDAKALPVVHVVDPGEAEIVLDLGQRNSLIFNNYSHFMNFCFVTS
jgi:hypothetical protein